MYRSQSFKGMLEEILESTMCNLMQEVNAGDFVLTQKPEFVEVTRSTESLLGGIPTVLGLNRRQSRI